jgi:hypothetical protein
MCRRIRSDDSSKIYVAFRRLPQCFVPNSLWFVPAGIETRRRPCSPGAIQCGTAPVTTSQTPGRIKENFEVEHAVVGDLRRNQVPDQI